MDPISKEKLINHQINTLYKSTLSIYWLKLVVIIYFNIVLKIETYVKLKNNFSDLILCRVIIYSLLNLI